MKRKIPPDAFDHYVSLGLERSYQTVADHFGVSKQAVTGRAKEEGWQRRLHEIEAKARAKGDKKAVETMEAVRDRHLMASRVIQTKALEALKQMSLETAMEAVRALDMGVKQERLLLGEPSERTAISVEDVIKREYERWMGSETGNGNDGSAQQAHALR